MKMLYTYTINNLVYVSANSRIHLGLENWTPCIIQTQDFNVWKGGSLMLLPHSLRCNITLQLIHWLQSGAAKLSVNSQEK